MTAFLAERRPAVALFIVGEFDLTAGSRVAAHPADFGLAEVYRIAGDELATGLFYEERTAAKSASEARRVDRAIARLSRGYRLASYPWAGSLSTAHSLLYYDRFGPDVFKRLAGRRSGVVPGARPRVARASFAVADVARQALWAEAEIWSVLVRQRRAVSRAAYRGLAADLPAARPAPGRWCFLAGHDPALVE